MQRVNISHEIWLFFCLHSKNLYRSQHACISNWISLTAIRRHYYYDPFVLILWDAPLIRILPQQPPTFSSVSNISSKYFPHALHLSNFVFCRPSSQTQAPFMLLFSIILPPPITPQPRPYLPTPRSFSHSCPRISVHNMHKISTYFFPTKLVVWTIL